MLKRPKGETSQESEAKYRGLLEAAPDAMVVVNQAGDIVLLNLQAEKQFGYQRDELVGQQVTNIIPEGFAERLIADDLRSAADALAQQIGTGIELSARRKDGTEFPIEIMLSPLESAEGILVTAAIRNISVRKAAERHLLQMEGRYRGLLEAAPDAMVVVNQGGEIVLLNVQAEKQFGYRRDELLGQRVTNIIPVGFAERLIADDLRSAEDALAQQIGTGIELTGRRKDGSEFPIEIMLSPLESAEGILVTAAIRNISVRKAAEGRYRGMLEQTERAQIATQAKSEFLSRMSHELRTPLNAILGFAQLLELDGLDGDRRESVDEILKGGRHLLDLINEVLDISRIEAGQLSLSLEPVSVGELVSDVISLIGPLGADNGVELRSELPDGAWHIFADHLRIRQVLLNLLGNAVKYSPSGATATVGAGRVEGGRIRITVEDSGPGIPPGLLSRLFAPFERIGAEATGVEGTGLGLSLSKTLVEAMGGTIGVDSTVGVGSRFWFELPETEPVTVGPEVMADLDEEPAPIGGRYGTILYIEDNLSNFRLVERVIERRGEVRLIPAMLGRLGLDLAREHRPDLVLLDLHLPDMAGDEVLRELRVDPTTAGIPVVILSADAMPGHAERLRESGAHAFLSKPIDVRELLALVDEFLPGGETPRPEPRVE